MISGPPISDTSRCDIGSPDITSDIDSDIGGIVLRYRRSYLRYHSTSDIGVNIGVLVLRYRSCGAVISEFPDIGDSDIGVGYCDIRKSPISGTVISGKTPISAGPGAGKPPSRNPDGPGPGPDSEVQVH